MAAGPRFTSILDCPSDTEFSNTVSSLAVSTGKEKGTLSGPLV